MSWEVEYTDTFGDWWMGLTLEEQKSVSVCVTLLESSEPHLPYPFSSAVRGSRHRHMRELRIQHQGRPYRVLYAFDPRRVAILLVGGDKTGNDVWYEEFVPRADRFYDEHLAELAREGPSDG